MPDLQNFSVTDNGDGTWSIAGEVWDSSRVTKGPLAKGALVFPDCLAQLPAEVIRDLLDRYAGDWLVIALAPTVKKADPTQDVPVFADPTPVKVGPIDTKPLPDPIAVAVDPVIDVKPGTK